MFFSIGVMQLVFVFAFWQQDMTCFFWAFWQQDMKCFFLHLGAFGDALGGGGQHLVIPMADDSSDWRAAVLARVRAGDSGLVPLVVTMRCTLNGKEVGGVCTLDDLEDATLRWRLPGLLGGAPKVKDVDVAKDVDRMNKEELMRYANAAPNGCGRIICQSLDLNHLVFYAKIFLH